MDRYRSHDQFKVIGKVIAIELEEGMEGVKTVQKRDQLDKCEFVVLSVRQC